MRTTKKVTPKEFLLGDVELYEGWSERRGLEISASITMDAPGVYVVRGRGRGLHTWTWPSLLSTRNLSEARREAQAFVRRETR